MSPDPAAPSEIPHSAEAEAALLGACLWEKGAFAEASRFCSVQDFWLAGHRSIWTAFGYQQERAGAPDWVTLPEAFRATGVTDEEEVATLWRLAGDCRIACHDQTLARYWAQTLEALGVRRRLIQASAKVATAGYDETDADEAVREAYQVLGAASERRFLVGETTIEQTTGDLFDRLNAGETSRGLATGLPRIDAAQKGLRPGELTLLAARTAHGKTALALQVARHVAGAGTPVAVLSLEMDADALTERLVSAEAGLPVRDILDGGGPPDGLQRVIDAIGPLAALPITFSVAQATSLPEVKRVVSRWADVGLAHLLIVDYVQLIGLGGKAGGNRAYEVGAVAQALRDLAQQYRIPVLALAQLNRAVEHRSDPKPVLADLRESGGLEQAADAVWLLWRPELLASPHPEDRGTAFVHLAKNRAGPLATEPLFFDAPTTRFRLLDDRHEGDL